ncbi:MAG: hypothetical protein Q7S37_00625 [bacterium]|nr:hypothetical protein [bacterium]
METGREKLKDEKGFYGSLDKNNSRSSCSCQSLLIIFLVLFILTTGLSYFGMKKLKTVKPSIFSLNILSHKNADRSEQKIKIYQSDLQSKISGSIGSLIPLSDKKILIKPNGIILEGTPLGSKNRLSFIAEPKVKNQKIVLENVRLVDVKQKSFLSPFPFIYTNIAKGVASAINQTVRFRVSDVELKEEEMILTVY